ncbi:hypothetical protein ACIFOE_05045 [Paenibacillus sp. NRS-1783]|uniref:hypothetical protein n=1 Tax=Paenibacillus sp. NRS-1783 TaxID=3233907 RepID=UPI003D2E7946
MILSEEEFVKMLNIIGIIIAILAFVFFPYLKQFCEDQEILSDRKWFLKRKNTGHLAKWEKSYRKSNEELSFMFYYKKESYRVLDILVMIYFFPLWLIYGIAYVSYVAGKWMFEKLKSIMNITVFTKKGSKP